MDTMEGLHRSQYCAEVSEADNGKEVVLTGWVERRRDHGGLIFIDLRDRTGIVQVVASPDYEKVSFDKAEQVRTEYVLAVRGIVRMRDKDTINPKMKTGTIEIRCEELRILNSSKTPPFYIEDNIDVDEKIRLKYRYLDLRRPEMQKNLIMRHKVKHAMRTFLNEHGFIDIETPELCKSTPEGARDYLVPSRVNEGKFYALPQSPQIFKQLLMISGMDRYYQIARCFRDEDLRADRQPEFTQLDMEMSFMDQEEILTLVEQMVHYIFKETLGHDVKLPIHRMTWDYAMENYGSDKPDLRFDMKFTDVTELVRTRTSKSSAASSTTAVRSKPSTSKATPTFPVVNWTASSNTSATTAPKAWLGSASSKTARSNRRSRSSLAKTSSVKSVKLAVLKRATWSS